MSEASLFHRSAWIFLSGLGFELVNTPETLNGPYGASQALYRTSDGFFLHVGFDPNDGGYAEVSCGRRWKIGNNGTHFSHTLNVLAKRFGFDLPEYYLLGRNMEFERSLERIKFDLRLVLPAVLKSVTLQDLEEIEQERFGAGERAESFLGKDFMHQVEVSDFEEVASS